MKKFIALLSVCVLMCSTTAFAASSPTAKGFSNSHDSKVAASRGMSSKEYYNNTVETTPGVKDAMPVGQGGKIIINGVTTNLTASLSKASDTEVKGAYAQAAALSGSLLNVVKVEFPGANYETATINFYLPGLADGKKVVVKQLLNGEWTDVEVLEVRLDHVVLNLKNAGPIAFVEVQ